MPTRLLTLLRFDAGIRSARRDRAAPAAPAVHLVARGEMRYGGAVGSARGQGGETLEELAALGLELLGLDHAGFELAL